MKPILFTADMVRAILLGRKTVTRRLVKPQPWRVYGGGNVELRCHTNGPHKGEWHCYWEDPPIDKVLNSPWGGQMTPPYSPGDVLYVRETWAHGYIETSDKEGSIEAWFEESPVGSEGYLGALSTFFYRADDEDFFNEVGIRWRPSIHMPKEAARLFLQVTDVRAERLQSIDEEGAVAEGCVPVVCPDCNGCGGSCPYCHGTGAIEPAVLDFVDTWNSTLKEKDLPLYGWSANPWVWVVAFERIERDSE